MCPDDLGERISYATQIFDFPETQFYICAKTNNTIIETLMKLDLDFLKDTLERLNQLSGDRRVAEAYKLTFQILGLSAEGLDKLENAMDKMYYE